jgi:hypothetical protein
MGSSGVHKDIQRLYEVSLAPPLAPSARPHPRACRGRPAARDAPVRVWIPTRRPLLPPQLYVAKTLFDAGALEPHAEPAWLYKDASGTVQVGLQPAPRLPARWGAGARVCAGAAA